MGTNFNDNGEIIRGDDVISNQHFNEDIPTFEPPTEFDEGKYKQLYKELYGEYPRDLNESSINKNNSKFVDLKKSQEEKEEETQASEQERAMLEEYENLRKLSEESRASKLL